MSTKVRAAVLVRPGQIEIREFDMPSLKEGGAIARVRLATSIRSAGKAFSIREQKMKSICPSRLSRGTKM